MKKWVIVSGLILGILITIVTMRSMLQTKMQMALSKSVVEYAIGHSAGTRGEYTTLAYGEEEFGMFNNSVSGGSSLFTYDSEMLESSFYMNYGKSFMVGPLIGTATEFKYGPKGASVTVNYQILGSITATVLNGSPL